MCQTSTSKGCARPGWPANHGSTSRIRPFGTSPSDSTPTVPGRPEQPGEFEAWFRYVLQRGTTLNGVFGAKMMWNYLDDFKLRMAELPGLGDLSFNERLDAVFPRLKIIFIRRRDKVAQAVSLWKAIQTQQWRTESESDSEQVDSRRGTRMSSTTTGPLSTCSTNCTGGTPTGRTGSTPQAGSRYGSSTTSSPLAGPPPIGRVLDALGIDPPAPEGKKPMQRQADDLSKDWVARFRADSEHRQRI